MNTIKYIEESQNQGWFFPEQSWDCLPEYEKCHYELGFINTSLDYYSTRVRAMELDGVGRVLDAGCGMGPWSIALADLNDTVEGIDISTNRLLTAREIVKGMDRRNVRFQYCPLEQITFPDSSFDAIFCYGVFMFTDMPSTLLEFHRVLKAGGKVYLNANTFGWYAHMLIDRGLRKRNIREMVSAMRMVVRAMFGLKRRALVRHRWLLNTFHRIGFSVIAQGLEGSICLSGDFPKPEPLAVPYHYGLPAIREYLITKK